MRVLTTLLWVLVLLVAAAAGFVYSGVYDIGADAPHTPLVAKAIATLRERSIEHRADRVAVTVDLDDPARVREGAEHYAEMCTGCHLAPGMHDSELRAGLYPQPPDLAHAPPVPPRRAFWVIKHGIKLTAMPAWGATHDDAKIWAMVAFVRRLPGMSPADYRTLTAAAHEEGGDRHAQGEGTERTEPAAASSARR